MLKKILLASVVSAVGLFQPIAHADVIGAIVGGAVGSQFGKGNGRLASTAIGAVVGDRISTYSYPYGGYEVRSNGRYERDYDDDDDDRGRHRGHRGHRGHGRYQDNSYYQQGYAPQGVYYQPAPVVVYQQPQYVYVVPQPYQGYQGYPAQPYPYRR